MGDRRQALPAGLAGVMALVLGCQAALPASRDDVAIGPGVPVGSSGRTVDKPSITPGDIDATADRNRPSITEWTARRPAVVTGPYGTTDTSGYDLATLDRLSAEPRLDGQFARRVADTYTYLRLSGTEQLASVSRLVVRGRPVAFSRPYFNSLDGSYWDVSLVGPEAGRDVASEILRDVLFEVDEVVGASDSASLLDPIEFTVRGGQAVVTISDTKAASEGDHPLSPGTYVIGSRPEVDLAIGESVIVFLDYVQLDGLYADGGTRFGYIYRLMPAHDLYYKWTIADGVVSNERFGSPGQLRLPDLRDLMASEAFGSAVGPPPDDKVHEQEPETH